MNLMPVLTRLGMLALTLLVPARLEAGLYTFTMIADASGPFDSFAGAAAITNDGTAVFWAALDSGAEGVFKGKGGAITTIAASGGAFGSIPPSVIAANNAGTATFRAFLASGERGVFIGDGSSITTVALSGSEFFAFGEPDINDSGAVAFGAFMDPTHTDQAIFRSSSGVHTKIVDTRDNPDPFSGLALSPAMNNAGLVVFVGNRSGIGNGVFAGDGGPVSIVADNSGPFHLFSSLAAVNDAGSVAFYAELDAGGTGIFAGNGGPYTTIATTGPVFSALASSAINNPGQVAFAATLASGQTGIFTGPDPIADKVIAPGDTLFGSTVTSVGFQRYGLNDRGEIAFLVTLEDGTHGIVRASPVPEPGTAMLLGTGIIGLVSWRLRVHRREKSPERE